MSSYQIAVLPGDGIGPEVMNATLPVLEKVSSLVDGLALHCVSHEAGASHYRHTGRALPDDVLENCRQADAVLLAAIGLPDVRQPDGTEVQPTMMVGLRRALDLHSALRPVKLYPGVPCPLKRSEPGIDMVIVRENLEGLFASFNGGGCVGQDVATDTLVITRKGTERVVNEAFQLAQRRDGRPTDGKKSVVCVDKANVFRSYAFFRKLFHEVALRYSDVHTDAVYVDAMSLYMVQNPWDFDVLVTENQFGDILSDLGAALVGGLGMAPSAEIGDQHALFQPSHGTAPQIAGKNVANPVATILSAAMMLDWLADCHNDQRCRQAATAIEAAVRKVVQDPDNHTPDLGGHASTTHVSQQIIHAMT